MRDQQTESSNALPDLGDRPLSNLMSAFYKERQKCRLCGSADLGDIIEFGLQALASHFPRQGEPDPEKAPLTLSRCCHCGLVQLRHTVNPGELYTYRYGYKSGINATMRG